MVDLLGARPVRFGVVPATGARVQRHSSARGSRVASGTTAPLRYRAPIGSYEFCTRLLERTGVMFTPGAAFGIEHTVRIGFADDTATLRTGLELVGWFLDDLAVQA